MVNFIIIDADEETFTITGKGDVKTRHGEEDCVKYLPL